MTALAPTLQSWFTDYLIGQRGVSANTIADSAWVLRRLFRLGFQAAGACGWAW